MAHRLDRWRWWIELDGEATLALVQNSALDRAYVLLHETGSVMHDERGPLVADSWSDICKLARANSSIFILAIHDKRVIRVAYGRTGVYVDCKYVYFVLNREALESITNDDHTHQEIEHEEAKRESRKHASGAEKRRRRRERGGV